MLSLATFLLLLGLADPSSSCVPQSSTVVLCESDEPTIIPALMLAPPLVSTGQYSYVTFDGVTVYVSFPN